MNEPTLYAQNEIGNKATVKSMVRIVRLGSTYLSLHGRATPGRECYSDSFIFELRATARDSKAKSETVTSIELPGWVRNGHTSNTVERTYGASKCLDYDQRYRPESGFWSITGSCCNLVSLLEMLPQDAEVSIEVGLDRLTTNVLKSAVVAMQHSTDQGLHGDALCLHVTHTKRGKLVTTAILLDAVTSLHNTARFGYLGSR